MHILNIATPQCCVFVDVTSEVARIVKHANLSEGICTVFCPHTTAGLTINENADPDVTRDLAMALDQMVPKHREYRHAEGNSPAHLKASLMGSSVTVIVENSRLALGTWQGIYLAEFDGPRQRQVWVNLT